MAGPEERIAARLRSVRRSATLFGVIVGLGTLGYGVLGLAPLDALYQTITTISTVGFREYGEVDADWQIFTIVVILAGTGTALYTLGVALEALVEGRLTDSLGRRRMNHRIADMRGHVIVCGWGRVGSTIANHVTGAGRDVVVVDRDAERLNRVPHAWVEGDATDDATLLAAGIDRAGTLIAALNTDADNIYVTLTARSLRADLFIVTRARVAAAEPKLERAGANRVVNPQHIGGARMAALALQPSVADFLDVVMHDGSLEFRLGEVHVPDRSALVGRSLRDSSLRDRTGALVLALREPDGSFVTNPAPDAEIRADQLLIAIGTEAQLAALHGIAQESR